MESGFPYSHRATGPINFSHLPPESRLKVNQLYAEKGFPADFRERIEILSPNTDWATLTDSTLRMQLASFVETIPDFCATFRAREGTYFKAFKECYVSETDLCSSIRHASAKKRHPSQSTVSKRRLSSQSTAVATTREKIALAPDLQPESQPVGLLGNHILILTSSKSLIRELLNKPMQLQEDLFRELENAAKLSNQIVGMFRELMDNFRLQQTRNALLVVCDDRKPKEVQELENDLGWMEVHTQRFVRLQYDFIEFSSVRAQKYAEIFSGYIREVTQVTFIASLQQQIIKDNVSFNASVRLPALPALKSLSSTNLCETVDFTYTVVYEKDLEMLIKDPGVQPVEAATFAEVNNRKTKSSKIAGVNWKLARFSHDDVSLLVTFENLRIEKVKTVGEVKLQQKKKKASSQPKEMPAETEKKTVILFTACIKFLNDRMLPVRTHSIALVLITHVKQKCPAWRTLFWHDAFSGTQISQTLAKEVSWESFIAALQRWFSARTGAELRVEHVKFIRRCVCNANEMVTYASLWEQPDLRARPKCPIRLQFWPFFYKCTTAIGEFDELRLLWNEGLLYGFVSNDDASDLLRRYPGNALIRFSNTKKRGAIVIMLSHVSSSQPCDVRICSLAPLAVKKGFGNFFASLADIDVQLLVPNADWKRQVCYEPLQPSLSDLEQDGRRTVYVPTTSKLVVPPPDQWPLAGVVIENDGTPCASDDEREQVLAQQSVKVEQFASPSNELALVSETFQLSISEMKSGASDMGIYSEYANANM